MTITVPKVVVFGSTYIDMAVKCGQIPAAGQAVTGLSFSYVLTGPGPIQAAQAALCGCDVHLISKIGGGPFGEFAKKSLSQLNVKTDFVFTAESKNTGSIVTLVNSEGENASCVSNGANTALLPRDIEAADEAISQADVCLIHGNLPQEAIIAAIRSAKIHRANVIVNPARPIGQQDKDLPAEYFPGNILIPNLYEAANITEHSVANINTAKLIGSDLIARGTDTAVITMGKRGCVVVDRTGADHIPAFEIDLVDKTCTGDAFAGALAASVAVGDNVREAVKFASAAGALVCTKFGSIEALPTKADIIELLQKQDTD